MGYHLCCTKCFEMCLMQNGVLKDPLLVFSNVLAYMLLPTSTPRSQAVTARPRTTMITRMTCFQPWFQLALIDHLHPSNRGWFIETSSPSTFSWTLRSMWKLETLAWPQTILLMWYALMSFGSAVSWWWKFNNWYLEVHVEVYKWNFDTVSSWCISCVFCLNVRIVMCYFLLCKPK